MWEKRGDAEEEKDMGVRIGKVINSVSKVIDSTPAGRKLSARSFLKFLSSAYHINQAIEGVSKESYFNECIDWTNITKSEMFNELVTMEERNRLKTGEIYQDCNCFYTDLPMESCPSVASQHFVDLIFGLTDSAGVDGEPREINEKEQSYGSSAEEMNGRKHPSRFQSYSQYNFNDNGKNSASTSQESLDSTVKSTLADIFQEGILDSVLPYLTPKHNPSSVQISKKSTSQESRKPYEKSISGSSNSSRESRRHRNPADGSHHTKTDSEVEIHVCDEAKNLKKDFKCSQKLLVSKMGYFAEVTTGQRLEDMDISVHCDINIFEWLMMWVKKDEDLTICALPEHSSLASSTTISHQVNAGPALDATNVVPILVSASFLQMEPLFETCLRFCKENMNEILKSPVNLSCLNDSILTRLANKFSNSEVESLKDKKDKIKSRLYCKLIMSLAQREPDSWRGHYSSLTDIYQCFYCKKLILHDLSLGIPCTNVRMRMNSDGGVVSLHYRDRLWNLTDYTETLKQELKCWRKVYWRLWGECHFVYCTTCNCYYSVYQQNTCVYHPQKPQFFSMEHQRTTTHPVGRYLCCGAKAFRFETIKNLRNGCKTKKHTPLVKRNKCAADTMKVFEHYQNVIISSDISSTSPTQSPSEKRTGGPVNEPSTVGEDKWSIALQCLPLRNRKGLLAYGLEKTKEENTRLGTYVDNALHQERRVKRQREKENERKLREGATFCPSGGDESVDDLSDSDEENDHLFNDSCSIDLAKDEESLIKSSGIYSKKDDAKTTGKISKTATGLSKSQWVSKFSTRYNQDNQRDYEERVLVSINSMLSRRMASGNVFNEKAVFENIAFTSSRITPSSMNPNSVYSSFATYCSALTAAARIHHARSTVWNWGWNSNWNSSTPLGGSYVRIEAEWREQQNIQSASTVPQNGNSNQISSAPTTRPRQSRLRQKR